MDIDRKESRYLFSFTVIFVFCGLAAVLLMHSCSSEARDALLHTVQNTAISFEWKITVIISSVVMFLPLALFASPYCAPVLGALTAVWGYVVGVFAFFLVISSENKGITGHILYSICVLPPAMELFAVASSAYSCRLSECMGKLRYRRKQAERYLAVIFLLCALFVLTELLSLLQ